MWDREGRQPMKCVLSSELTIASEWRLVPLRNPGVVQNIRVILWWERAGWDIYIPIPSSHSLRAAFREP